MKSIKKHFEKEYTIDSGMSSYIAFANAVTEKGFSKAMISRWFTKLVDKDDYENSDRRKIIENLGLLSNPLTTTEKS